MTTPFRRRERVATSELSPACFEKLYHHSQKVTGRLGQITSTQRTPANTSSNLIPPNLPAEKRLILAGTRRNEFVITFLPTDQTLIVRRIGCRLVSVDAPDDFVITQEGNPSVHPEVISIGRAETNWVLITHAPTGERLFIGAANYRRILFCATPLFHVGRRPRTTQLTEAAA